MKGGALVNDWARQPCEPINHGVRHDYCADIATGTTFRQLQFLAWNRLGAVPPHLQAGLLPLSRDKLWLRLPWPNANAPMAVTGFANQRVAFDKRNGRSNEAGENAST